MSKKEYWENINKKDRELAIKYPEINGGYEFYSESGEVILRLKPEQTLRYPMGFIHSGIIRELNGNTVKVFNIIISISNRKYRNTTALNEMIGKLSGISHNTVDKAIQELNFYHLIHIHYLPGGSRKDRRRKITLSRWDTARALLVNEKKVVIGLDNKVTFPIPNPYKK
ncbi:hypothetical protein ES708_33773 [subsurface metagenome]